MYTLLKKVAISFPHARIRNVIDDCVVQSVGTERFVLDQTGGAFSMLLKGLEERKLPISKAKTVFLASSDTLAQSLLQKWEHLHLADDARQHSTRNVGTDAGDGSMRRCPIAAKRREEALSRSSRLLRLRNGNTEVRSVHRSGPIASFMWGAHVTGMTPAQLHQQRVAAAKSEGRLQRGASVALRLHASAHGAMLDPLPLYYSKIARAWAESMWDGTFNPALLQKCLVASQTRLKQARYPWKEARMW